MRRRETYLGLAQHHVAEAEARVAHQKQIIHDIERDNHPRRLKGRNVCAPACGLRTEE
jgi:hypothetical protein